MAPSIGLPLAVLALPFIAFVLLAVAAPLRRAGRAAGLVSILTMALAFAAALTVWARGLVVEATWTWIPADGGPIASVGLMVDSLSQAMLVLVTLVSLLVQIYSLAYLHDEPPASLGRYYTYQSLFAFSMLGLVLAPGFLQMFIFWELVGLCSYLLIGYWYERPAAARAAVKAFWITKLGDVGFIIGIVLLWSATGTFEFTELFDKAQSVSGLPLIMFLIYLGAVGKSAQFPLHVWLPDAMEGPTPVSALIHAATMVTAGVYMVARSHAIFERSPVALEVVAWIGVATALFAATIGLVQTDIKRVLAYSTVSQLGYMFAAVGVGAYAAGIFHLVTHAFFKALLFLGAGSVIHGLGGEQDLRKMGGLSSRMVATTITTTIGGLALAGMPGLAGFFSKDEILAAAFGSGHKGIWALLLLGAFLTSFYTSRMLFLAFYSGPRMTREAAHHVHESPGVMTWPLAVLALLTVITGIAFGIPSDHGTRFERFLAPVFPIHESGHSGAVALLLLLSAVMAFVAGVVVAWVMYMASGVRAEGIGRPTTPIHALLLNAYWVDLLYDRAIVRPLMALSRFLAGVFDTRLVDGLVNAVGRTVVACAAGLRRLQTGYTVNYALTMLAGAVAIAAFLLVR